MSTGGTTTMIGGAVTGGAVTGGAVTGGAVTGGAVTGGAVTGGIVTGGAVVVVVVVDGAVVVVVLVVGATVVVVVDGAVVVVVVVVGATVVVVVVGGTVVVVVVGATVVDVVVGASVVGGCVVGGNVVGGAVVVVHPHVGGGVHGEGCQPGGGVQWVLGGGHGLWPPLPPAPAVLAGTTIRGRATQAATAMRFWRDMAANPSSWLRQNTPSPRPFWGHVLFSFSLAFANKAEALTLVRATSR